jgi:iron(III) transport system substrate-binding protein
MQEAGVIQFPNEFRISNQVASGEIVSGFANHYYALRVQSQRSNAPLNLAFTSGDAGALINVSGAEVIQGTQDEELATNFIRHLLSSEAQEFFATRTFAYPTVPGVQPVGGLPTVDELNPPDIDLSELANTGPTLDLLDETGVL